MAKALGVTHMAMPTNGNAGAALAAYASRAGIKTTVFCPEDTPEVNVQRDRAAGRHRLSRQRPDRRLRQDRRAGQGEGRLVRHFDAEGAVPDRGQEDHGARTRRAARLGAAGRHPLSDRRRHRARSACGRRSRSSRPSASSARSARAWWRCRRRAARRWCAPTSAGVEHAPRWEDAQTIAAGIRVPQAVGDFLILRAVRESGGFAIAVDGRRDHRGARRGRARGRPAAVPGGRRDLRGAQAEPRRRPHPPRRARACCSTARPASNIRCRRSTARSIARSRSISRAVIRTIHVISGRRAMTKLIMAAAIAALVAIIGGGRGATLSVSPRHHDRAVSGRRPVGRARTHPLRAAALRARPADRDRERRGRGRQYRHRPARARRARRLHASASASGPRTSSMP